MVSGVIDDIAYFHHLFYNYTIFERFDVVSNFFPRKWKIIYI